ncbi:surface lipoprotein assembly modifier [Ramlibacter sp. H39-3-26]|uniref:surface lipoprotein assembly modifier n=1 Tax=Curvibacter soli TaxID=3031331 RepID=UPI0023DAE4CB|nr:surface lipoprotein assembly modifier [Ramlibacter sp. H39-3-26]MDF1483832.1 surface lipoprotein assembly modifier [Ramlibacter sp. H39-3-26]
MLGCAGCALAHAQDGLPQRAAILLGQGQAAEAFRLLDAEEPRQAGDPAFDAAMGAAAYAAGQYVRSILAWERVVAVQPDDVEAQLGLARALFAVGDKQGALRISDQVRAQGVPVDAALSIDQFLYTYDRSERSGWSSVKGYIEATVGHDSNVNAGPSNAQLVSPVPGTPAWTLAPSALKTSSAFASAFAWVGGRYVIDPRWSLVGRASGTVRGYESHADMFDSSEADLAAGVSFRGTERQEFTLTGQSSYYALDHTKLRGITGLVGEWTYRLDGFRQWSSFVQWLRLRYPTQPLRDVRRTVVGTSYAQVFRDGSIAYGGIYGGREAPRADDVEYLGHHLFGIRLGGQYAINNRWAVFVNLDHERRRFGADDPFFALTRRDRQTNLGIGLSWVPAPAWRITPQVMLTRSASNLPINDYDRSVVSVTARREF